MYRVTLEPAGYRFTVMAGETVLAAALRAGYTFPMSCRNGVCGLCKGRLLKGRVHYGGVGLHGLSETEQAAGYALFCTARPETDLHIEVLNVLAPGQFPVKTIAFQIAALQAVSDDTWAVRLRPPVFDRPKFLAGHYLFLLMPDGSRRAFSIASAPQQDEFLELHIRAAADNAAALAVIAALQNSPVIKAELPHGQCVVRDSERPLIFVAGGTGFAPIKAQIESLLAAGLTRPIHLYRGAHSLDHLYLRELPANWAANSELVRYTEVLSGNDPSWTGRLGLVHQAVLEDYSDLSPYDVYIGGREEMVLAAYAAFQKQGLPAEHCYSDMIDILKSAGKL